jgi:uncharacterized DUF497 family protein
MILGFNWDETKDVVNQMKHGVSFETAKMVFFDPKRYEIYDFFHSSTEDRWKTIGFSGCNMLSVIFTEKNKLIRIISARKANRAEQEEYFNENGL